MGWSGGSEEFRTTTQDERRSSVWWISLGEVWIVKPEVSEEYRTRNREGIVWRSSRRSPTIFRRRGRDCERGETTDGEIVVGITQDHVLNAFVVEPFSGIARLLWNRPNVQGDDFYLAKITPD